MATAGTFVFEPPGDIHAFVNDGDEDTVVLFILSGSLQFFDEHDQVTSQDDVFTLYKRYVDYCGKHDLAISADLVY